MFFYEFPFISTIEDVLPYIEGKSEFTVSKKQDYTVINYNFIKEDTFLDPGQDNISEEESLARAIRMECRVLSSIKMVQLQDAP